MKPEQRERRYVDIGTPRGREILNQLERVARERGITVPELVRAVIIPDWLSSLERKEARSKRQG